MSEIDSETKFVWKFLLNILLTPITLFLVLIGKKEFKEIFKPFKLLFEFVVEAKVTLTLIIINCVIFGITLFLPESILNSLVSYPADVLSLRIYSVVTAGFLHAGLEHLLGNMSHHSQHQNTKRSVLFLDQ